MLIDSENTMEIYAQLHSPPPFFQTFGSKPTDKICVSSNVNFFIHTANQVYGFNMPKVHQMIGPDLINKSLTFGIHFPV